MHQRRWHERLRQSAEAEHQRALESVHRGQRNAVGGTAIPAGYPSREALLAAGYVCTEDLPDPTGDARDDARDELGRVEGMSPDDIDALLTHLGFDLTDDT